MDEAMVGMPLEERRKKSLEALAAYGFDPQQALQIYELYEQYIEQWKSDTTAKRTDKSLTDYIIDKLTEEKDNYDSLVN